MLTDFEQVENLVVILVTWGRLNCFSDGCFWDGYLTFRICKTPLGETGCLGSPYFLVTGCLSIQFFGSILFFNIVRSPLATYSSLCSTFVTYSTSCHAIGHKVLPTHPLLRVRRIWQNVFYSQAFFTLHSFLLLSRHPWGWPFTLKGSRASCWLSKHSPGLSIVWNERNPQKRYSGRFYLCV